MHEQRDSLHVPEALGLDQNICEQSPFTQVVQSICQEHASLLGRITTENQVILRKRYRSGEREVVPADIVHRLITSIGRFSMGPINKNLKTTSLNTVNYLESIAQSLGISDMEHKEQWPAIAEEAREKLKQAFEQSWESNSDFRKTVVAGLKFKEQPRAQSAENAKTLCNAIIDQFARFPLWQIYIYKTYSTLNPQGKIVKKPAPPLYTDWIQRNVGHLFNIPAIELTTSFQDTPPGIPDENS